MSAACVRRSAGSVWIATNARHGRLFRDLETELAVKACLRVEHPRANEVSERFTDGAVEDGEVGIFWSRFLRGVVRLWRTRRSKKVVCTDRLGFRVQIVGDSIGQVFA